MCALRTVGLRPLDQLLRRTHEHGPSVLCSHALELERTGRREPLVATLSAENDHNIGVVTYIQQIWRHAAQVEVKQQAARLDGEHAMVGDSIDHQRACGVAHGHQLGAHLVEQSKAAGSARAAGSVAGIVWPRCRESERSQ